MFQLKRNWIIWHLFTNKAQELFVPVGCLKLGVKFRGSLSNKASEPVPIQKWSGRTTLSSGLGSKKQILQVISRIGSQQTLYS